MGLARSQSSVSNGQFIAHVAERHDGSVVYQPIDEHLREVARRASDHGAPFGGDCWAKIAGLWHDVGKYSRAFQAYIRQETGVDVHQADSVPRTDHSTAGAQHAVAEFGVLGHPLAYVIAGHHSGLLDGRSDGASLERRLAKTVEVWAEAPESIRLQPPCEPPGFLREAAAACDAFSVAFFTRMLFSCLVDADFLDTESFMNPDQGANRPAWPSDVLERMQGALDQRLASLRSDASHVNRMRAKVLAACRQAASQYPGMFSLTVPTGGGKTLSSLAFALDHAIAHGLRRVIYVVPFTSIIEQNADVFRKVYEPLVASGMPDPVVEHHSNVEHSTDESVTSRLATENWDAPLVVTTSVQFYESLFANRSSRSRKLHNVAESVVILDEVQVLPVDYLAPCLRALSELSANYRTTVVLCTATQPALHQREDFAIGLNEVREIIPKPAELYTSLRRVEVDEVGELADEEVARQLEAEEQVLCIVNTRGHARMLFDALGDEESHFHLSALMCPEHRSQMLRRIRNRLDHGKRCRVISTQLIEAGVDIDFPVVYRSLTGLDSIAQAAGRCNRNGTLESGLTVVFRSQHRSSEGFLSDVVNSATQVMPLYDDPLSLEAVEHFFRLYFWEQSDRWDAREILNEFHMVQDAELPFLFNFTTVASRFRLIEDRGAPVIVPWDERGRRLCDVLRYAPVPGRGVLRRLQRYTVQIRLRAWEENAGAFELVHDRYPILADLEQHYSEQTGLNLGANEPLVF